MKLNIWAVLPYLSTLGTILGSIQGSLSNLTTGQPVDVPQVRTYIGGHHVALDIKITPLP